MAEKHDLRINVDTSQADEAISGAVAAMERLESRIVDDLPPKENLASGGPRNLPKPSAKKKARLVVRESRRRNRTKPHRTRSHPRRGSLGR